MKECSVPLNQCLFEVVPVAHLVEQGRKKNGFAVEKIVEKTDIAKCCFSVINN